MKVLSKILLVVGILMVGAGILLLMLKPISLMNTQHSSSDGFNTMEDVATSVKLYVKILVGGFLVIGASVLMGFFERKRIIKNGVSVSATITGVEQTGVYVNNAPQVRIHVDYRTHEGERLTGSVKRTVQLIELAQLQIGATISIIYDPNNPHNITM